MSKPKPKPEHGYIQLSLFDFLNEEPEIEIKEPPKPKVFQNGTKWLLPNGSGIELYWDKGKKSILRFFRDGKLGLEGLNARIYCFQNFDWRLPRGEDYLPITEETMVCFAAMCFDFYDGERDLNKESDSSWKIPWFSEEKYQRIVLEELGYTKKEPINAKCSERVYDLRDVLVFKWLNLGELPTRYYERINKEKGEKRYYDISMTFGEMLRYAKARPMA